MPAYSCTVNWGTNRFLIGFEAHLLKFIPGTIKPVSSLWLVKGPGGAFTIFARYAEPIKNAV